MSEGNVSPLEVDGQDMEMTRVGTLSTRPFFRPACHACHVWLDYYAFHSRKAVTNSSIYVFLVLSQTRQLMHRYSRKTKPFATVGDEISASKRNHGAVACSCCQDLKASAISAPWSCLALFVP